MKIALIGTRGIPATHGGFETCVEEIGQRLVEYGHTVYVYTESKKETQKLKEYKGMNIIYISRIKIKGLETLFSTYLSTFHSLFCSFDFHMVFNGANSPALIFYKILRKKYAINTDGLEWQRDKWGFLGKNYYKMSERISVALCRNLVSDSQGIHDYYKTKYQAESTIIAYGAVVPSAHTEQKVNHFLNELGLTKGNYILQVTRFEPENNPLMTIQAFKKTENNLKAVIIGGANYPTAYMSEIEAEAEVSDRIVLPGFIYHKERLEILWQNAYCYVHGNGVGGTNPALLQAMAAGRPVLSIDCRFNRETLDNNAVFFKRNINSLVDAMKFAFSNHDIVEEYAKKAFERVTNIYTWEKITKQYESLFNSVINRIKK